MSDAAALQQQLEQSGEAYLYQGELPTSRLDLRFTGPFEGRTVVWNAQLFTMQAYAESHSVAADPLQVIEIRQEQGTYFLDIALNIEQIDQAAIERTIIMIRKYKRLSLGRHEYGARSKTV